MSCDKLNSLGGRGGLVVSMVSVQAKGCEFNSLHGLLFFRAILFLHEICELVMLLSINRIKQTINNIEIYTYLYFVKI